MKISKQLNNNIVIAFDDQGREVVLMGKGIGFGCKPGAQHGAGGKAILRSQQRHPYPAAGRAAGPHSAGAPLTGNRDRGTRSGKAPKAPERDLGPDGLRPHQLRHRAAEEGPGPDQRPVVGNQEILS